MNSKKAQSEVITTVLIILLVLAAIIIVWQVVQVTMKQNEQGIVWNKMCIGSQLSIVSATAGNGTCPYTDTAGHSCPTSVKAITLTGPLGYCPQTPSDTTNCNSLASATILPNPTVGAGNPGALPGQVIVERDPSTGNDFPVTVKVFVNDKPISVTGAALNVYGKEPISIVGLNASDQVKVASILSTGDYICPPTDSVKVTTS